MGRALGVAGRMAVEGARGVGTMRVHCGGIEGALWGPCGAATAGWGGAWRGSGRGTAMGNGKKVGAKFGDGLAAVVGQGRGVWGTSSCKLVAN